MPIASQFLCSAVMTKIFDWDKNVSNARSEFNWSKDILQFARWEWKICFNVSSRVTCNNCILQNL